MNLTFRHYHHPDDYWRVDRFLIEHYQPANQDGNWIEPAWEYMHHHSLLDSESLEKIGLWEHEGQIVAVAHYEWHLGEAFFQFHPAYRHLRQELLDYAEANLFGRSTRDGRKYLCAYVNDNDPDFCALLQERGYQLDPEENRPMARLVIPDPFPPIHLPPGFRLVSLAEKPDWGKVNSVLWRGFDHPGDPPGGEEELESRRKMFETPNARMDLKIAVAVASPASQEDGKFVAFCGMFYQPDHHYAYVEPVATDPDYRRLGLGKAAVLEGIRRCATLGAQEAFVGSDQAFYLALGFEVVYTSQCWLKYLEQ